MTNQHIHYQKTIISQIWKEEYITPFLAANNQYKLDLQAKIRN